MIKIWKYIMPQGNRKKNSFVKGIFVLCSALFLFQHNSLFAQVITNNGAVITVSSAVVNSRDIENTVGSIGNNGTINLSGNFRSAATTNGSGIFTIGGNWTNTGGTLSGFNTVIFNGSDNQSIIRTGDETFFNLSIENSGASASKSISLSNNVTVTGTLSMHIGNVSTTTNKLLLSNSLASSLNYTSVTGSRIFGKFERRISQMGTYLFPLGTAAFYNPANLITKSVPTEGTVLSEFLTSPPPGNAGLPLPDPPVEVADAYPDGYWSLTAANGFSSEKFSINLDASGFIAPIYDITRVIKRTEDGNWTLDGTHSDASGTVVRREDMTGNISTDGTQFALGRSRPLIIVHPVSQIVCERTNPVFSVTATGAGTLTYIWYKDGIAIANSSHYTGNRTATLTIINAVLSDAGNYYCVVRDRYLNATTSNSALLTVNKIPVATATPSLQGNECSGVAFSDIVLGESYGVPGTTYIWSRTNPSGITTPVALNGTAPSIGSVLAGYFTNITDDPITIVFTIRPVGPNPTNCVGSDITATIIVNPTPKVVVTNVKPEICYGTSTEIRLTSPTHVTQGVVKFDYTVSIAAPPAIVAGNRSYDTDVLQNAVLSYAYTNESDVLQSVFYNVTPKIAGLGCPTGIVVSPEVKVHPKTIQYNYAGTSGDGILITTPLTCDGGSDAALMVITSNGAGPYYFEWSRTSVDKVEGYSIPAIVNRKGGRWDVIVTDNLQCKNESYQFVQGAYLDSYMYVVDKTGFGTTCPGSNDGEIGIRETNSSTGIAPFEYWIVRNNQDTVVHSTLPGTEITQKWDDLYPGNYTLFIKDANGCYNISYPQANIVAPDTIKVVFEADTLRGGYNVSCKGYSDSHVRIKTISGGNGGYSYQWYYDAALTNPIPGQTSSEISGLPAGTYYLRTIDVKSCLKVDSVTITEPDGMQLISSETSHSPDGNTNISCYRGDDGYIKLTLSGGSGNYIYSWSGPNGFTANTKDISGLKAGDYVCKVSDLNGCDLTPSPTFTLTEPSALNLTSTTSVSADGSYNINCNGGTGTIDISVTGGSTVGLYQYEWSTTDGSGLIDGQKDQNSLTAGTYNLVVTDSNRCSVTASISLIQPLPLIIQLSGKNITCEVPGFNNGEVNLTVSGGVAPYSYSWSNGASTEDLVGLTEGYYRVIVTDINGCSKTDSIRINLPPPISYTKILSDYNGYNIKCYGLSDGSIQIDPTSGLAPFIYTWSGTNGFTSSSKDISNLTAGEYKLLITDSNYCTSTETFNLNEPGELGMAFSLSSSNAGGYNINCAGDSTGFIGIEPLNQVRTAEYLWSDGITGKTRMDLPAGEYRVVMTDANICQTSATITLTQPDSMKLVFDASKPFCPDMPDGEIKISVTGGVPGADYSYKWSDNSTGRNISNILRGFYKIVVNDLNNCTLKDSINIEPLHETCLIIPNAISPNDDLINDVWNIGNIELYPQLEIKIFNRWGESIWRSAKGYPQPWDGKSNGHVLPIDSYHYIIDLHNGTKPLVGNVTIVR
jgi:gliding motility-associated-like protein